MDRIWKKLTLRIKDESYREQVYWWFKTRNRMVSGRRWLTILLITNWPEEPFPIHCAAERSEEPMRIGLRMASKL
jgi:hypothetical protein